MLAVVVGHHTLEVRLVRAVLEAEERAARVRVRLLAQPTLVVVAVVHLKAIRLLLAVQEL